MRQCYVLVHRVVAGLLTESDTPMEYIFKYFPDYVLKGLPPVSLTLPVREEEYRSDVLFPYFFNLLSEGDNRMLQASLHHLDKDDDFGILLATAQFDTAGAVTIQPIRE